MKHKTAPVEDTLKDKLKRAFTENVDTNTERLKELKSKLERLEQISILSH